MGPAHDNRRLFLSSIILAVGTSTRMGRAKQLLPLGSRPLLQHVVDATAASCLDEIILVLGQHAEGIRTAIHCPERVRVVLNTGYAEGRSTSLHAGLRAASPRAAAAAVLLGAQRRGTAQLIDRVAAAFANSAACLVRPVYSGVGGHSVPGHPVFWARRVWPDIDDVDTREDYRSSVGYAAPSTLQVTAENLRGRT